ncbi:hypothetical protein ACKWTF_015882 [Chironomus riparius]
MKASSRNNITSTLTSFLIILTLYPHQSSQQLIINNSTAIEATCIFSYDQQNRYSCELLNARLTNPTDILVISGTHLPRHSDIDVQALIHANASFAQFNGEALRKFINLKFIDLRRVWIDVINENAFEVCGHLEELHMGFNGFIEGLPQGMLRNCESLRIFYGPDLRVLSLPENLFGNSRNLEVFDMTSSPLRSFPDSLLQNMTNIRIFRISGNFVDFLHPNNLINAVNIEEIDISWNNFNDTQHIINILHGHLGLKKIIISNNQFEIFDFNFLAQFQRLEELSIGGRPQMTSITWHFLPNSLTSLTVNQIGENISENAFEQLKNLIILRLTGFGITSLHQNTFKELKNLEQLSIMFTNITTLHPQLFASQGNLRVLVLNSNQIEDLPDGIFKPLVNLGLNESSRGLSIFINKIQRVSISAFGYHPHLNHIDFAHNEIDEIERGLFSQFSPKMSLVDFAFNRCISRIFWNVTKVNEIEDFQPCFDNFDGITTVPTATPNGCGTKFGKFELILIIFAIIFENFMNTIN